MLKQFCLTFKKMQSISEFCNWLLNVHFVRVICTKLEIYSVASILNERKTRNINHTFSAKKVLPERNIVIQNKRCVLIRLFFDCIKLFPSFQRYRHSYTTNCIFKCSLSNRRFSITTTLDGHVSNIEH